MLDVGWSEILVIAIVIIVVVGPKDLPKMLRAFGKATARMRATADEFRRQFDDALREAELEEVKNTIEDARRLDPRTDIRKVFDPIRSAGEELRQSLHKPPIVESTPASDIVTLVPPPPPEPVPSDPSPASAETVPAIAPAAAVPARTPSVTASTVAADAIPASMKKPTRAAKTTETPKPAAASPRKKAEPAAKTTKPRATKAKTKANETEA
jgi:sec-independent protein translocase protein TatB